MTSLFVTSVKGHMKRGPREMEPIMGLGGREIDIRGFYDH